MTIEKNEDEIFEVIREIREIICLDITDWDEIPDFTETFQNKGFKVNEGYLDEDRIEFSTDISWYKQFSLVKDNISYSVYLNGSAIAEISYDRWVDSFAYNIEEIEISLTK